MSKIENMTEEQLQHKLYDIYQLDWMMYHGHSISEIIKGMSEVARESGDQYITTYDGDRYTGEAHFEKDAVDYMYGQWEKDSGFKGEIFASFDEFCENEYLNAAYMHELMETQSPEITERLKEAYGEYMKAAEERDQQDMLSKDNIRVYPLDTLGEVVFKHISEALEEEKGCIELHADIQMVYEDKYSPKSLEEAIKVYSHVGVTDMLDVLKREAQMENKQPLSPFADMVLDGALKYDTKFHRKEAYNKVKEWMKKPCNKVIQEIEKLQEKNRQQGR